MRNRRILTKVENSYKRDENVHKMGKILSKVENGYKRDENVQKAGENVL